MFMQGAARLDGRDFLADTPTLSEHAWISQRRSEAAA